VRQRLDDRSVNGEHWVEQMGKMDALGLGNETKQSAVSVKAPRLPFFNDLQFGLAIAVQQLVANPTGRVLVGKFDRV